jgi:hypothetical protein
MTIADDRAKPDVEGLIRHDLNERVKLDLGIFSDIARRVLDEGRFYPAPAMARRKGIRKMANKGCYANAFRRASEQGWTYCEGYAHHGGVVIAHAWCIAEGEIIETTWKITGGGYLGIAIDFRHVAETAVRTGSHGSVLEADWFANEGPLDHLTGDPLQVWLDDL